MDRAHLCLIETGADLFTVVDKTKGVLGFFVVRRRINRLAEAAIIRAVRSD
jgi:hypothetical protein